MRIPPPTGCVPCVINNGPPIELLACEADVKALLFSLALCRELGAAGAFDTWRKREVLLGTLDRSALLEFVRMSTTTVFHPTSTCRMGIDGMAVVHPELKVYGPTTRFPAV